MHKNKHEHRGRQFCIFLLSWLVLLGSTGSATAQGTNPIHSLDSTLREFFSPLCRPVPSPNILWDMSSHTLDSMFYTDNNPDTLQTDAWFKLYEELRNGAYDTTVMITHDSAYNRGADVQQDTVSMYLLAYNYYQFNDSALTSDYCFDFNTNSAGELVSITEKHPCEVYPYVTNRVFASAPNTYFLPYQQVTYRIDPSLFFYDSDNDFTRHGWNIEIDFGDGSGWHMYTPHSVFYETINYTTSGLKYIQTRINTPGGLSPVMTSLAEIKVPERAVPPAPQYKIVMPDLIAGVYEPCEGSGEPLKKIIIVVEGFDPGDLSVFWGSNVGDIYQTMVKRPHLETLLNFGYTFVVVNWVNSRRDIKLNAAALEGLIMRLKCDMLGDADISTNEQFVIIAESMGGLVARYAMCDMEQNWRTLGGCQAEKMHNTRLLITYDSPHEGVNIPLAYQHTYRDIGTFALGTNSITQAITGAMSNVLLDAKSVKQMLLYHVDTWNPANDHYSEHPDKTAFDLTLGALGNYPQYSKVVAMSDGSMEGHGQTRIYDGAQRVPNDYLLNYRSEIWIKVLGQEFQTHAINFKLKTTPAGSGDLTTINTDLFFPYIVPKITIIPRWPWPPKIKIKLEVRSKYLTSIGLTHRAKGMEPYDVIPGSTEAAASSLIYKSNTDFGSGVTGLAYSAFFGFKHPVYDPSTHTYSIQKTAGVSGFKGNLNASLYSDGMHFCFVPVFSALNYNLSGHGYWHDITSNTAGTNMSRTPVDVIIGEIREDAFNNMLRYSRPHVSARNEILGSWRSGIQTSDFFFYDACDDNPNPAPIYLLNREIGDDSLLIENRTTQWKSLYDAEKYIGVNERSPYYDYPTATGSGFIFPGVYSKQDPYVIGSSTTTFKARHANVVITGTLPGSYVIDSIAWVRCCFGGTLKRTDPVHAMQAQVPGELVIIPNPVSYSEFLLAFPAETDQASKVTLYNSLGQVVLEQSFAVAGPDEHFRHRVAMKEQFATGIYYVVVKNGSKLFKKTLQVE